MKKTIFLDQATSYHPLKEVMDILKKRVDPHSLSSLFQTKEAFLEKQGRIQAIRNSFGAKKESFFAITAGGEQAIAQAQNLHYYKDIFHSGKQHILIAKADEALFSSELEKLNLLGVYHEYLEGDSQGHITQEILLKAITPRTSLVMLSWAHPVTGVIQPIGDIVKLCHEKGIRCLVDASHVIGKLYFSLEDFNIDYLTFDAMPFQGPYKVGGLFVQNLEKISLKEDTFPLQLEALEESLMHAKDKIDTMNLEIVRLRNTFEKQLLARIPSAKVLFQETERLAHISVIAFPFIASEYFLYLLSQDHLYASIAEDDLLESIGIDPTLAKCSLSFSLSCETKQEELEEALERICKHYAKAKELFLEDV